MLLTVCTIRQLPQALTLAASLRQQHPDPTDWPVVIGLADDPGRLPVGFTLPPGVSLLTLADWLPEPVAEVSARYTPTEFVAVTKPGFVRAALRRFSPREGLIYADPSSYIYQSISDLRHSMIGKTLRLTPHLSQPPTDALFPDQTQPDRTRPDRTRPDRTRPDRTRPDRTRPDEKYLQNIGLYSAGWLAFGIGVETERLLAWWQDRSLAHGKVDFCAGTCADQLWLMHTLTMFSGVEIDRDPAAQVALWNLPERRLSRNSGGNWLVNGSHLLAGEEQGRPLLSANFRGLTDPTEGYFTQQNRLKISQRADVQALLADYRAELTRQTDTSLTSITPAYGQEPEPVILTGWRYVAATRLRQTIRHVERFDWPSRVVR